jgi:hypothetical protein
MSDGGVVRADVERFSGDVLGWALVQIAGAGKRPVLYCRDGSVATILTKDARRWWAGSDRSCGPIEQVGDKGGLAADIMTVNLSNLSLPHHRHGLEARQRLPRRTETAEA